MQKARKSPVVAPPSPSLFQRVRVERAPQGPIGTLRLGDGVEIELTAAAEPAWVAELARAWSKAQ